MNIPSTIACPNQKYDRGGDPAAVSDERRSFGVLRAVRQRQVQPLLRACKGGAVVAAALSGEDPQVRSSAQRHYAETGGRPGKTRVTGRPKAAVRDRPTSCTDPTHRAAGQAGTRLRRGTGGVGAIDSPPLLEADILERLGGVPVVACSSPVVTSACGQIAESDPGAGAMAGGRKLFEARVGGLEGLFGVVESALLHERAAQYEDFRYSIASSGLPSMRFSPPMLFSRPARLRWSFSSS